MASKNEFNFRTVKRNRKIGGVGRTTPPTHIPKHSEIKEVIKNNVEPSKLPIVPRRPVEKHIPKRVGGFLANINENKYMYIKFYEFLYENRDENDEIEFNFHGIKEAYGDISRQQVSEFLESMEDKFLIHRISRTKGKYSTTKLKLLAKPTQFETH